MLSVEFLKKFDVIILSAISNDPMGTNLKMLQTK